MLNEIIRRRRALHRIPETAFELKETREYLLNEINAWDCEVETVARCGISCFFNAGKTESWAFRSDMDALNIAEASGVDFASLHTGKMHACGHDGHMAMLLALGDWANGNKARLKRNILLIFQPAEETAEGAREVISSGVLEKYHVSRMYALHVDPWTRAGVITSRPGAMMARTSEVYATFRGKAAHAAMSEKGIDAVQALCEFVVRAVDMEKNIDGDIPRLLKFGMLNGGTAVNIIAEKATASGTMRAFSDEVYDYMKNALHEIAGSVCEKYKTTYDINLTNGACAVINDEVLFDEAQKALSDIQFETLPKPTMIAEDFALYGKNIPILMLFVGTGSGMALHSVNFAMDERALGPGARALIKIAEY